MGWSSIHLSIFIGLTNLDGKTHQFLTVDTFFGYFKGQSYFFQCLPLRTRFACNLKGFYTRVLLYMPNDYPYHDLVTMSTIWSWLISPGYTSHYNCDIDQFTNSWQNSPHHPSRCVFINLLIFFKNRCSKDHHDLDHGHRRTKCLPF